MFSCLILRFVLEGGSLTAPPRVTSAVPDNGDSGVDPALAELRITFDQDMNTGGRSICGGGPLFPKIEGEIRWDGKRTIVIPVTLEAEHEYALSVNCPAARNFRGADGEPAEIYPIQFKTGGASRKPGEKAGSATGALSLEQNRAAIAELRKAIDERYSYRDLRKLDWDKSFSGAAAKLENAKTAAEFARELGRMLATAQDPHISVWVGEAAFPVYRREFKPNFNLKTLAGGVPGWKQHNDCVATGTFDDDTGYILIGSWGGNCKDALEPAFEALGSLKPGAALVIDVRTNGGGDETLARKFAGCFVDKALVYSKNSYRDGQGKDGFTAPIDRVVEPNRGRPHFSGKVAVLIGPACMSSNESFIAMMKAAGATLVGATTAGSSGNPKPVELSNGVRVNLPSWKDMLPDGTLLEGRGITPDVPVSAETADFERGDPVLAAALKKLRG